MIWFGEDALRRGISEFVSHYHFERNHQGLDNRLIIPKETTTATIGKVRKRERLGGMLNYYFREVA
jgi:putative transposase